MANYGKGKIYKIQANVDDSPVYIGSTTKQYLSQRMEKHRSDYKRWNAGTGNKYSSFEIFDQYGIENCNIILIESFPCDSKDQLRAREDHFIKSIANCINKNNAYIADMKQYQKEYQKSPKWKEYNKEYQKSTKCKNWKNYKISCECGGKYTIVNKLRHFKSKKHQNHEFLDNL